MPRRATAAARPGLPVPDRPAIQRSAASPRDRPAARLTPRPLITCWPRSRLAPLTRSPRSTAWVTSRQQARPYRPDRRVVPSSITSSSESTGCPLMPARHFRDQRQPEQPPSRPPWPRSPPVHVVLNQARPWYGHPIRPRSRNAGRAAPGLNGPLLPACRSIWRPARAAAPMRSVSPRTLRPTMGERAVRFRCR